MISQGQSSDLGDYDKFILIKEKFENSVETLIGEANRRQFQEKKIIKQNHNGQENPGDPIEN